MTLRSDQLRISVPITVRFLSEYSVRVLIIVRSHAYIGLAAFI